jgi:F-type H+-transporting ATPase subunit delta
MATGRTGKKPENNQTNENNLKIMKQNSHPDAKQIAEGIINYLKEENLTQTLPEIISFLKLAGGRDLTEAKAETAIGLTSEEQAAVKSLLEAQLGWKGEVKFEVNPKIIGGLKITIGDKVLDLSVKGKLNNIYEQI